MYKFVTLGHGIIFLTEVAVVAFAYAVVKYVDYKDTLAYKKAHSPDSIPSSFVGELYRSFKDKTCAKIEFE